MWITLEVGHVIVTILFTKLVVFEAKWLRHDPNINLCIVIILIRMQMLSSVLWAGNPLNL